VTPPGPSPCSVSNAHEPDITTLRRDPDPVVESGLEVVWKIITGWSSKAAVVRL
jgi:hypothetical protein